MMKDLAQCLRTYAWAFGIVILFLGLGLAVLRRCNQGAMSAKETLLFYSAGSLLCIAAWFTKKYYYQ